MLHFKYHNERKVKLTCWEGIFFMMLLFGSVQRGGSMVVIVCVDGDNNIIFTTLCTAADREG